MKAAMDPAVISSPFISSTTILDSPSKPQPQAEQAPAVRQFRVSASIRSRLNRQGRALCRLLHNNGHSISEIAGIIEGAPMTVAKVIRNGYRSKDNAADDYKFVGDEFIAKYKIKPPSTAHTFTQAIGEEEVVCNTEELQPSVSVTKRVIEVPPVPRRGRQTSASISDQTQMHMASGSSLPTRSRRHAIPARFCPITQERRIPAVSRGDLDDDSDTYDGLRDFLSSLKFDLSMWYPEMKRKGFGTEEDLLAISDWEEECLDRVFKKMLPDMPELHIYALTEGVMAFSKTIG